MDDLTSTTGIVALAAAGVALLATVLAIVLLVQLRRLRADQKAVLGPEGGATDLVAHAAGLERSFGALHDYVVDVAERLDARLDTVEGRMDGAIAHCGLLRYDAYNEMSGRQSTSIALLDRSRSGVILSSIHHRDQARLYAKQVTGGKAELQLSPEEEEAVRLALEPRPPGETAPPAT